MGWEALEQWGDDVARIEPLTGGVGVNEVWSVRVNGHLAVGRLGQRATLISRGRPTCCDTSTVKVCRCRCRSRPRTAGSSPTVWW